MLADETNRYTRLKIQKSQPLQPRSVWHGWVDVTAEEMRTFHGVLLFMALDRKKAMYDFFSATWVKSSNFCLDIFSRARFTQIFWGLHVGRDAAEDGQFENRRSKVQGVIDYLQNLFLRYYTPSSQLSADESTVPFKGRIGFAIYNPLKPTHLGVRLVDIADSLTGYILHLIPYYGAESNAILPFPEHSWATRIILTLVDRVRSHYQYTGFHVFTDRLYTSVTLAKELHKWEIHLTGTLNASRMYSPPQVKNKNLKLDKDQTVSYICSNRYNVVAWKDKREVKVLSTLYGNETVELHRKRRGNLPDEIVHKPIMIQDYTKYMGGVDRADHYVSSYGFVQKSLKWWRKVYFFVLEVAVVNSFLLYKLHCKSQNQKSVTHKKFREKLIVQLVGSTIRNESRKRWKRPNEEEERVRLNGFYHQIGVRENRSQKTCRVCSSRATGQRRETIYHCLTCPGFPGLHPENCFHRFHTLEDYRMPIQ